MTKTYTIRGYASTRAVFVNGTALDPAPSQKIWNHSPTGFSWGYGGSGAAQFALALLLKLGFDDESAFHAYQDFKWDYIATLPMDEDFKLELTPDDMHIFALRHKTRIDV